MVVDMSKKGVMEKKHVTETWNRVKAGRRDKTKEDKGDHHIQHTLDVAKMFCLCVFSASSARSSARDNAPAFMT
jgi:hypothetical protein